MSASSFDTVGALTFDIFGTVVDWRTSIVCDGEEIGRAKGIDLDWTAFADAWRALYQPAMQRVRTGEIDWCVLDDLHRMNLDELLKKSNIISFHTPLTNETKGMADEWFFDQLNQNTVLINTARGPIINLDILYKKLKNNSLKAAGLDVLQNEPPDFEHPLIVSWSNNDQWLNGRIIITPHAAFYNSESFIEMRSKAALEVKRVLEGQNPYNRII